MLVLVTPAHFVWGFRLNFGTGSRREQELETGDSGKERHGREGRGNERREGRRGDNHLVIQRMGLGGEEMEEIREENREQGDKGDSHHFQDISLPNGASSKVAVKVFTTGAAKQKI